MKIDFIIVSGILVFISFLPFILFPLLRIQMEKNLQKKFRESAFNLSINVGYELKWNNNIAGIDILKRQFLFVQKIGEDFIIQHVDLNGVRDIKLVEHTAESKPGENIKQALTKVDLEFYRNPLSEAVTVSLFDHDLNYTQDLEVKNAGKLVAELKKYLAAQPVLKRIA